MGNLQGLVEGLSQGINNYLGTKAKTEQEYGLANYKSSLEEQRQTDLETKKTSDETARQMAMKLYEQTLAGKIDPQTASTVAPEASTWVQNFNNTNQRMPTVDEFNKGYVTANKANEKSNIRHYLGNDPKGNAIFSDNEGNMFGPDKQPYSGVVLPKSSTMPTAQARSSGEFASTILPHITEMRDLISQADKAGYIGPTAGRVYGQFLAGKVGTTGDDNADRLLGQLRSMDSLLKTGAMKVHFGSRGGQNMYEHFSDMLNTGKQSAAMLNGSLDTIEQFMQGYQAAGQPQGSSLSNNTSIDAKKAALRAKLGI